MKVLRTKALGSTPAKKLESLINKWNGYDKMAENAYGEALHQVLQLIQKEVKDLFKQYPELKFELLLNDYDRDLLAYCGYKYKHEFPSEMPSPKVYAPKNMFPMTLWKDE